MEFFNVLLLVLMVVHILVNFFVLAEVHEKIDKNKKTLEGMKETIEDMDASMKEILEDIEDIRLRRLELQENIEQSPRIKAASNNYLYEAQRRAARNMAQEYTPIGNDGGEG